MKHLTHFLLLALLGLFLMCIPEGLHAQQSFTVKGIIVKSQGNDRLAQVKITDLKTNEIRFTDEHGMFTIPTHLGDTLEFNKADFTIQKLAITSSNDMVVYLQPIVVLSTVTVKGSSVKQDQQDAMDDYRKKGVYYNGKPSVWQDIASPLNGLYTAFSKDAKRARRFSADVKAENEAISVDHRFSKALVKQITGMTDAEATVFMEVYRPSYEDVKKWSDYDLITYIKKSYADYNHKALPN